MVSIYRHGNFVNMKIVYLQQDLGQDPQRLFSESVLNEVSVYTWELTGEINSLKELTLAGKAFLNDQAYLPSAKSNVSHTTIRNGKFG